MYLWRNTLLIKLTLFFFLTMVLVNPVNAQSSLTEKGSFATKNKFPIRYVTEVEAQKLVWQLQKNGFSVKEGTLAELDELTLEAGRPEQSDTSSKVENGEDVPPKPSEDDLQKDCEKNALRKNNDQNIPGSASDKPDNPQNIDIDTLAKGEKTKAPDVVDCSQAEPVPVATADHQDQENADLIEREIQPEPQPEASDDIEAIPPYDPGPHVHLGVHSNVTYSSGGNDRDLAKVFFIFAGLAVVAAFIVYAGKYVSDIVRGKSLPVWRELIFNNTFLSTGSGRHGYFSGAKLAVGFVSDELIQLALTGEIGSADVDLILNENTDPLPLNFSASYWMLGASARLHLTTSLVNASYLYLDLMGGTTSNNNTDLIGAARMGASFGINDYWRIGGSFGAQYIGLNKDQGFVNDGDNYWVTYGLEVGARF